MLRSALRVAVAVLLVSACWGCASDERFSVAFRFTFGAAPDSPPPMGDGNRKIRLDVCLDSSNCPFEDMSPVGAPEAGRYEIPLSEDPQDNQMILVARPDSSVGSNLEIRAWLAAQGTCCGILCSPLFPGLVGFDGEASDGHLVPYDIPMIDCPPEAFCDEGVWLCGSTDGDGG